MPSIIIDKAKPETVDVEIPSYPGSVITMLRRLPLQQNRDIARKYPKAQERDIDQGYNASLEQLSYAIKDWNLAENVDGEEKKFEITPENIGALFSDPDVLLLGAVLRGKARQIEGTKWEVMTEEEKKS